MAENPLVVPSPVNRDAPAGTQAAPVVTTPARKAVERGMRQEGVINQIREASLERAKIAGRTAQQHVDMVNAAALAAVGAALDHAAAPSVVAPAAAPAVAPENPTPPPSASVATPSSAPVAVAPVAVPSAPTLTPPTPSVASPAAPPGASPSSELPPKFPNKQVEVSWNTIRESEKQIVAQRAQFQQEKAAFEAEKAKLTAPNPELQNLQQLQQGLKTNLAGTLKSLGYTAPQIAEVAVALNGTPAQAPVAQPVQQGLVPQQPPVPQRAEPSPELVELRQQVQQLSQTALTLQNVIITQNYNAELSKPEFELLRTMPDALDRAIGAWQTHHGATGKALSIAEACGRAQEELVAAKKAEFERLNSNPAWSKALGSTAQPSAGSAPAPSPATGAPSAQPPITSISANLAPGGPVPPVTAQPTQWLPPEQRRQAEAIERARKAGETSFTR